MVVSRPPMFSDVIYEKDFSLPLIGFVGGDKLRWITYLLTYLRNEVFEGGLV